MGERQTVRLRLLGLRVEAGGCLPTGSRALKVPPLERRLSLGHRLRGRRIGRPARHTPRDARVL